MRQFRRDGRRVSLRSRDGLQHRRRLQCRYRGATASGVAATSSAAARGVGGDAHPLGVLALLGAACLDALVHVLLKRDARAISPLTLNALGAPAPEPSA